MDAPKHPLEQVRSDLNPAFATSAEAFMTDSAAKILLERNTVKSQYQGRLSARRAAHQQREWRLEQQREALFQRQQSEVQRLQSRPLSRRHKGVEDFNIITLEYHASPGGQQLQAKHDSIRARSARRAGNLYTHSHSVSHDIITGKDLTTPRTVPADFAVRPPWQ